MGERSLDSILSDDVESEIAVLAGEEHLRAKPLQGEEHLSSAPLPGETALNADSQGVLTPKPASSGAAAKKSDGETPKAGAAQQASVETDVKPHESGAPSAQSEPVSHRGLREAKQEETRKRQEVERLYAQSQETVQSLRDEVKRLAGQMEVYSQHLKPKKEEPKQLSEDEKYELYLRDPVKFNESLVEQRVGQVLEKLGVFENNFNSAKTEFTGALSEQQWNLTLKWSEGAMRQQHPDYDATAQKFRVMADQRPELWQQIKASPHPAQMAYEYVKQVESIPEGVRTVEDLRKHFYAQFQAESENATQEQRAQQAAAGITTSSASAPSAGSSPVAPVELPLAEILAAI